MSDKRFLFGITILGLAIIATPICLFIGLLLAAIIFIWEMIEKYNHKP